MGCFHPVDWSSDHGPLRQQWIVLPPKLAPIQVVIVPIYKNFDQLAQISEKVKELVEKLKGRGIRVKYDDRDSQRPGWKFAEYEMKGVPVRLAIGPRDLENGSIEIARRDTLEKKREKLEGIDQLIEDLLVGNSKQYLQQST